MVIVFFRQPYEKNFASPSTINRYQKKYYTVFIKFLSIDFTKLVTTTVYNRCTFAIQI